MKKKTIFGIGAGALTLGLLASAIGLSIANNQAKGAEALDATYVYFKTPWNESTASIWAFSGSSSDKSIALTKASDYIWKVERSELSGYNQFIVRNTHEWNHGKTGDLNTSSISSADFFEVSDGSTNVWHWGLFGTMNNWNDSGYTFTYNNSSEVKLENISLAKGARFQIRKVDTMGSGTTQYYGYAKINQASTSSAADFTDPGDNCMTANADGTNSYSFYFNMGAGTNSLWITNPNRVAMDGWAAGFIGVDEFCDAGDTDWNTYAASFAALDPGARAYFNDATADKDGDNIAKAAYRYDNAVSKKGKTPFAEAGGKRASAGYIIAPMKGMEGGLTTAIAVTAAVGAAAAVGFFFIRKRKAI